MKPTQRVILVTVEEHEYVGHRVSFNDYFAYFRRWDGHDAEEVVSEACRALGDLVAERLGYSRNDVPADS